MYDYPGLLKHNVRQETIIKPEEIVEFWKEISDDCNGVITYVDEIRLVLARHAKPKVSPESRFLPDDLQQKEGQGSP